jgi:RNA polymerase sigma-70 factor (ECF subfamily)
MSRDRVDEAAHARDAALATRVRMGDTDAFDQLFCAYYPAVVHFAITMGQSREAAEDAASEVFAAIWHGRAEWTVERAAVRSYLFAAVRNRILKLARHDKVRAAHLAEAASEDTVLEPLGLGAIETHEIRRVLMTAVRALSERRRLALHLRFTQGLTYQEIGKVLGISARSANELIERALLTLRQALDSAG